MEFRQLEAFVAVADWSSFSEAARKLSLTQPAISAHIQSLEDELATQLIVRSTRSLALTKEGVLLYEYATSVLKLRKKIYEEFACLLYTSIGGNCPCFLWFGLANRDYFFISC